MKGDYGGYLLFCTPRYATRKDALSACLDLFIPILELKQESFSVSPTVLSSTPDTEILRAAAKCVCVGGGAHQGSITMTFPALVHSEQSR